MKDRLNTILKQFKISASQFADAIGVQRASVSHVLSERNKPGFDFIQKILDAYPAVSAEWLITGKGEMLKRKLTGQDLFSEADLIEPRVSESGNEKKVISKPTDSESVTNRKIFPKRNIEKIVVFYTDQSFKEYFPE